MDIIQRNLFRLLRSAAFDTQEQIEPMSVFKWGRLYQLALMHQVTAYAYEGLLRCRNQFSLHMTARQWEEWQKAATEAKDKTEPDDMEDDEFLRPDHLTNPILNHKLQDILDDEHSDTTTRQLLLLMVRIARHLLNEGMPIRQILEMGFFLRRRKDHTDFETLKKWIERLQLTQMAQLQGEFLVLFYGFDHEDLPFLNEKKDRRIDRIAQELMAFTNTRSQDWYFSQRGDSIFVHNSNTTAMFGHVRRSARYFRYYPSESITNFFASFLHSLSHIEE